MPDNRRVDFADIRKRADFRAVLAHYGLPPVEKGDQVKIRCPVPSSWPVVEPGRAG
jgi:hypothetical protein